MASSEPLDARQKVLSLAAAIAIVLIGNWVYTYARHKWYENPKRVIGRMYEECVESIDARIQTSSSSTLEQKAEMQVKGKQECNQIKKSCTENFNQQFCTFAQKLFQHPE
jgi:ethanolamine transporter EutH